MPGSKRNRKTFAETRKLVRLALRDMTQGEIAKKCRTQQSVVSDWVNGKRLASETQIAALLALYGSRLNRTTARTYLVRSGWPESGHWGQTKAGEQLAELVCTQGRGPLERIARSDPNGAAYLVHDMSISPGEPPQLVRVEGGVIFRYTFSWPKVTAWREKRRLAREPWARWIVHRGPGDRLALVRQWRRLLPPKNAERWNEQLRELRLQGDEKLVWVECYDDAARWLCHLEGWMTATELIAFGDRWFADRPAGDDPHDEMVVPFLLRKALHEAGFSVPGIVYVSDRIDEPIHSQQQDGAAIEDHGSVRADATS